MIVDHQSHWYPPAALDALVGRTEGYPRVERVDGKYAIESAPGRQMSFAGYLAPSFVDVDEQLRVADEVGVDMLLSSPTGLGDVFDMEASEAAEFCELLHEELARMQRERPDRFRGLAMLPLHHPETALEVLERAVAVHDLRGVCVLASIQGEPIAPPELLPVYQAIERLGLPLFLHPTPRSYTSDRFLGNLIEGGLGWMFHTSVAALHLIDAGLLDDCPNLVVVHPHRGGTLPYLLGRLDRIGASGRERKVSEYLRDRFYTDTVSTTGPALRLAVDAYGLDRVLFATDFPFENMAQLRANVEASASPEETAAILRRNRVGRIVEPLDAVSPL